MRTRKPLPEKSFATLQIFRPSLKGRVKCVARRYEKFSLFHS